MNGNLPLTANELADVGLHAFGHDVQVSPQALLIAPQFIRLGSHVRIDAFCVLSAGPAGIFVGDHVHISAGVSIFGGGGMVRLDDFAAISGKSSIYTVNDDYREGWLIGPTVPDEFRKLQTGEVILEKHALVGSGSVILPGVTLGTGCAVGALSLIRRSVAPYQIMVGNPLRTVGARDAERLAMLEKKLRQVEAEAEQ